MTISKFASISDLKAAASQLPLGDDASARAVSAREAELTKPPGSLGRLEELVTWLARWQHRAPPELKQVDVIVFAGNHGVTRQGVSAYPAEVTTQMVANFKSGGAAINQIARIAAARLQVVELDLDRPTGDITEGPAMNEREFIAAVNTGCAAVSPNIDLLCLGDMGIGNTTVAAAIAAALFGGDMAWVGRGTMVDDATLERKRAVVQRALARHSSILGEPLLVAACLGGRELAAILGATLAARQKRIPVLLDGFISTVAAAPLFKLRPDALEHALAAHVSAEMGHKRLLEQLRLKPLLDLGMRLGEASGAGVAINILRTALACHSGMATFAQAGVANRD